MATMSTIGTSHSYFDGAATGMASTAAGTMLVHGYDDNTSTDWGTMVQSDTIVQSDTMVPSGTTKIKGIATF